MQNEDKQRVEEARQVLREAYALLPEKTQNFLVSKDFQEFVDYLLKKYQMNVEEARRFQEMMVAALLGLTEWSEARDHIGIAFRDRSTAEIEEILKTIEEKISPYLPNREEMKRALEEREQTQEDSQEESEPSNETL